MRRCGCGVVLSFGRWVGARRHCTGCFGSKDLGSRPYGVRSGCRNGRNVIFLVQIGPVLTTRRSELGSKVEARRRGERERLLRGYRLLDGRLLARGL